MGDLIARFFLGGVIVSAVALLGDLFKPKTFGGLFGAAPSVALATLAMAFATKGGAYVATEGRSMAVGAVAMGFYSMTCIWLMRLDKVPPWAGAGLAWGIWLAVAFALNTAFLS